MTGVPLPGPLWLIGCGNMAGAMLTRWLHQGMNPAQVTVVRPSGNPVADGVRVLTALPEDEVPAIAMLGVKPQKLDVVAPLLAPALEAETILVSILAGVELNSLRERFPTPRSVVRAMPNMPVQLGKGVINLFGAAADAETHTRITRLMEPLGHTEWFSEEPLFQAAGAVTGAGPAYVFRFIDALAEAAETLGLPREQAARLSLAMVEGTGAWAAAAGESPAQLARRVASPGGTTQAGLEVLDRDGALEKLILAALEAARRRSTEMAQAARRGQPTPS
jgi:pyrroline-5-carboxylate reductase